MVGTGVGWFTLARSLLAGSPVEYEVDPLRDLNLPAFLDKFVAKKPKVRGVLLFLLSVVVGG